ncbi:unnamed protein product [Polarella glacialis]|uniref:Uncharacterized protein n=1 Tax=Polarella glacialis TaxID=89957 RepID=A0A813FK68_POLGL|nr:unnamed protein product [Polarella glacialis]
MAGGYFSQDDGGEELLELENRIVTQRAQNEQLQQKLEATTAEMDSAKEACLAGAEAARVQMGRMREELKLLQSYQDAFRQQMLEADEEQSSTAPLQWQSPATEEDRSRRETMQLEARSLRYELSKWRHQVEVLEASRPQQDKEIGRLKAELTHAHDVLESTRHAVRHLEVERIGDEGHEPRSLNSSGAKGADASGAGLGSIEAVAERRIREMHEGRGAELQSKSKRLGNVLAAQKLLIHRLQKQLLTEEGSLEQKDARLMGEARLHLRLKVALRQRSDDVVVDTVMGKIANKQRDVVINKAISAAKGPQAALEPIGISPDGGGPVRSASLPHIAG